MGDNNISTNNTIENMVNRQEEWKNVSHDVNDNTQKSGDKISWLLEKINPENKEH